MDRFYLTDKGIEYITKATTQEKLKLIFTKGEYGKGAPSETPTKVTALAVKVGNLKVSGVKTQDEHVVIETQFRNVDERGELVVEPFHMTEMALYAKTATVQDGGGTTDTDAEALLCYACVKGDDNGDYIPDTPTQFLVNWTIAVNNTDKIEATVDIGALTKQRDFDAHRNAEEIDHPDSSITTKKIRDKNVTEPKIADGAVTLSRLNSEVTDKFNYAFDVVYPIDIEQRGSGNNILYITVPGVESYDDMDGKAVALNTGIYCVQWDTPQTVYININGLGSKALYRPLPSNTHTDYDTRAYYTDKYVKGEISRYQTLIVSFRKDSSNVTATLLNPAPAARATKAVSESPDDEFSYVTPKGVYEAIGLAQMNVTYDEENKQLTFAYGAGFTGGGSGGGAGYVLPVASANRLGGIKVGTGINMDDDGTANVLAEIDPELVMTAEEMRRLVNEALEEV